MVSRSPLWWWIRFTRVVALVILVPSIDTIWSPTWSPATWAAVREWWSQVENASTPTWLAEGSPTKDSDTHARISAMTPCISTPAEPKRALRG